MNKKVQEHSIAIPPSSFMNKNEAYFIKMLHLAQANTCMRHQRCDASLTVCAGTDAQTLGALGSQSALANGVDSHAAQEQHTAANNDHTADPAMIATAAHLFL